MPMTLSAAAQAPTLKLEQDQDGAAIEVLLDHAFGPGRFTKVSERVREIAEFRQDLSFCAWDGGRLVGCVRMTRIAIGDTEAMFLGPLAVEEDVRKFGTGGLLVQAACDAAQAAGFANVLLVGDEPYFSRFGFAAAPAKAVRLPGPVDQLRVLVRALREGGADCLSGLVTAPLP
ncbi:GNAT family N-acetyltransferase [Phenylobacterium sp.]|uniref:GNAT family N-acetyltransferase n=1 Tax=Phenylobacterium sp. TaxID=1871053 RepID=UPI0027279C97|nr:N-acetyltransferase [Phenylobacterium sp.]MDO8800934.1 N-acetyltransferase [Phenylobacterium sp.]